MDVSRTLLANRLLDIPHQVPKMREAVSPEKELFLLAFA